MSAIRKYLEHDYLDQNDINTHKYLEDYYYLAKPVNPAFQVGSGLNFTATVDQDPIATNVYVQFVKDNGSVSAVYIPNSGNAEYKELLNQTPGNYTVKFRYYIQVNHESGITNYNSDFSDTTYNVTFFSGTVVDPVIDDGGVYAAEKLVTITTSSSGATIRYTTDGSDPSEVKRRGLLGCIYSDRRRYDQSDRI